MSLDNRNSFTALRLTLATFVIWGHSYPLGGFGLDPLSFWSQNQISIHMLALQGFFAISGYFLWHSWKHNPSPLRFLARRAARIMPAYWINLLLSGLIIAPILYGILSMWEMGYWESLQFQNFSALTYITKNAFLEQNQWTIGPIFFHNPYPRIFNGSMWTLIYEALCYLLFLVFLIAQKSHKRFSCIALFALIYAIFVFTSQPDYGEFPWNFPGVTWVLQLFLGNSNGLGIAFFAGVAFGALFGYDSSALNAKHIILSFLLLILSIQHNFYHLAWPFLLTFIVIGIGHFKCFSKLEQIGDYSYGVYLYGFTVQQILAMAGVQHLGVLFYIASSFIFSLIPAIFSWHLIEKPTMKLSGAFLNKYAIKSK